MAQVSYTSIAHVSKATRRRDIEALYMAMIHLDAFDVSMLSYVVNADRTITIVCDGPIPQEQLDHLGLTP